MLPQQFNPIVIDDFLPPEMADNVYKLFGNPAMQWDFAKGELDTYGIERHPTDELFYIEEPHANHVQMRHQFVSDGEIVSDNFKYVECLIDNYRRSFNLQDVFIERMKGNLLFNVEGPKLSPPHIDGWFSEDTNPNGKVTLLYYVNNSDGDTIIYNERVTEPNQKIGKLTVCERVSPKKGRAVIFNSNQLHSACCPTNKRYRMVLNTVFG